MGLRVRKTNKEEIQNLKETSSTTYPAQSDKDKCICRPDIWNMQMKGVNRRTHLIYYAYEMVPEKVQMSYFKIY